MSADDVAHALQLLSVDLDEAKKGVFYAKSGVDAAKRNVNSIVGSANGLGSIQSLRGAATEFGKASDQVDVAYESLKVATDVVQTYLSAHFGRSGGGSVAEWSTESPVGNAHTEAFSRAQRRNQIKKDLVTAAKGMVAVVGVGTFVVALSTGATLGAALAVTSVVPDVVAFGISSIGHMHDLKVLNDSGATREELKKTFMWIAAESAGEIFAMSTKPLGLVLDFKDTIMFMMFIIELHNRLEERRERQ